MSHRIVRVIGAATFAAIAVSGCTGTKPGTCPSAAVLVPTSSLTTFKPGSHDDPAGEVYTIGMSNVKTDCSLDADEGTTDSKLDLEIHAKRPTPGDEASYRVPYYVAVSRNGEIIDKHINWLNFSFAAGSATADISENIPSTIVNLENGKKPYDYELLVGFQLTHDQLEFNKKMSRYAP